MANESNKPNISGQTAGEQEQAREPLPLKHGDLLSDDTLQLPAVPQSAEFSGVANTQAAPGTVLQFEELLSSIDSHPTLAGGVLTFDSDSSPGHTIVRVMLDDNGAQQAFEVGVFNEAGMDLNSLLGLILPHGSDHC